jgi:hypothetical protein
MLARVERSSSDPKTLNTAKFDSTMVLS